MAAKASFLVGADDMGIKVVPTHALEKDLLLFLTLY